MLTSVIMMKIAVMNENYFKTRFDHDYSCNVSVVMVQKIM